MSEWYLDLSDGTPWLQQVLGKPGPVSPDIAIRERIAATPYVTRLIDYASSWNTTARSFTVGARIATAFGTTAFVVNLSAPLFQTGAPGQPGQQSIAPPR